MKTEKIITKTSSRCLNVSASKVESLRINDDLENTVRVYDNGAIGVDGVLGNADFNAMEQSARKKLSQGIPYPETHGKPMTITADAAKTILSDKEFIPQISALLERLARENTDFSFSNKVMLNDTDKTYENSDGTLLKYKGNQFICSLAIKHKGSANIMDEFYGCESDYFDADKICRDIKMQCGAFLNLLPQIAEDEAVIIGGFEPLQIAASHFAADAYFNKASLFDGKLGQKLFSEKLNIVIDRSPERQLNLPFFDAEGVVNDGYINYLVKDGVLEKLATCKKSAEQYATDNLGSAAASYNGVPQAGLNGFDVSDTAKSLSALIKGKAVYMSYTSGGDMTPSGDISLPSIVSYLYDSGKLVGRLPEFTVTGNIFDILGKDFVGVTQNGLYEFGRFKYMVYKAKLVNKV